MRTHLSDLSPVLLRFPAPLLTESPAFRSVCLMLVPPAELLVSDTFSSEAFHPGQEGKEAVSLLSVGCARTLEE